MYTNTKKYHLVLLDFSGTLSMGAVHFGSPENLSAALRKSGLGSLGVQNPTEFWSRCIAPFWNRGGTSYAGYTALLAEALEKEYAASPDEALKGAELFRELYFRASRIDDVWKPLLEFLGTSKKTMGTIVTDHYAEATGHIVKELARVDTQGISVKESPGIPQGFLGIANSADLGFFKEQKGFWEVLREQLPCSWENIFLVEDFGANEPLGDLYGKFRRVLERRRKTGEHLRKAFQRSPKIYECSLSGKCRNKPELFAREHAMMVQSITKKLKEALS
jgi:hypothetical protein